MNRNKRNGLAFISFIGIIAAAFKAYSPSTADTDFQNKVLKELKNRYSQEFFLVNETQDDLGRIKYIVSPEKDKKLTFSVIVSDKEYNDEDDNATGNMPSIDDITNNDTSESLIISENYKKVFIKNKVKQLAKKYHINLHYSNTGINLYYSSYKDIDNAAKKAIVVCQKISKFESFLEDTKCAFPFDIRPKINNKTAHNGMFLEMFFDEHQEYSQNEIKKELSRNYLEYSKYYKFDTSKIPKE